MMQLQNGQLGWGYDKPGWMGFAPSTLEVPVYTQKKSITTSEPRKKK